MKVERRCNQMGQTDTHTRDSEGAVREMKRRIVPAVWLRPGRSWLEGSAACQLGGDDEW